MADQVRVYALVNPALIAEAQDVIAGALYRVLGISDPAAHEVVVSRSGGWMSYVAKEELWTRRHPPVLPTGDVARQRAERFLAALAAETAPGARSWPENLARVSLLPRLLRPVQLSVVPRADGSAWDHWLYRAQPRLALDPSGRRSVPVFGSQVEVRVGDRGQIVSCSARWRPPSGERITVELVPFGPSPGEHGGEGHGHHGTPAHDLQYVLDGEDIPQHYLAPYYLTSDGHMLRAVSACPYSLTVEFGRVQGAESMLVTAAASGGSGDYVYNLAAYDLGRLEDGLTELGPGQTLEVENETGTTRIAAVELPNGAYMLMVNVRDRSNGAFKHHQQQVVSTLSIEQTRSVLVQLPVA
jgi:hypothetical protein